MYENLAIKHKMSVHYFVSAKKTSLFGIKSPFALGPMAVGTPKQAAAEKKPSLLRYTLGQLLNSISENYPDLFKHSNLTI